MRSLPHSERPAISVVIPAFNAEDTIGLQLDALNSQEGAPDFEVVVVDNASTDGTSALVRSRMEHVGFRLRLISATEYQGPGYARNAGASAAHADLLMFADAADVVSRWWVACGMRAFDSSVLWSGGAVLMSDEDMAGNLDQIRTAAGDSPQWFEVIPGDLSEGFPVLMGGDFGCTREVFERVGGFDQSMGTAFDDNDFGVRAHLAGIAVDEAPSVRIAYRGTWDLKSRARLARRQARGHILVRERYGLRSQSRMPPAAREILNPLLAAGLMVVGARERDWSAPYLRVSTGLGLLEGELRYRMRKSLPSPQVGVGYERRSMAPGGETRETDR